MTAPTPETLAEVERMLLPKPLHTAQEIRDALDYYPENGIFVWRQQPARKFNKQSGKVAGSLTSGGLYRHVCIDGRVYGAHRLAWLHFYGEWPTLLIDHIDGDGRNNCIQNLRLATFSDNARNRGVSRGTISGLKGAHLSEGGRWNSSICVGGKSIHLGRFSTKEDAHQAYCRASAKLHGEFSNFGHVEARRGLRRSAELAQQETEKS